MSLLLLFPQPEAPPVTEQGGARLVSVFDYLKREPLVLRLAGIPPETVVGLPSVRAVRRMLVYSVPRADQVGKPALRRFWKMELRVVEARTNLGAPLVAALHPEEDDALLASFFTGELSDN